MWTISAHLCGLEREEVRGADAAARMRNAALVLGALGAIAAERLRFLLAW